MSRTAQVEIQKIRIDLGNLRTIKQRNETSAIQSMISISADRFWALMESLIEDGYVPTENIVIIKCGDDSGEYEVKEGNRRIAALKLIHGIAPMSKFNLPREIQDKISGISASWKDLNQKVPCIIFDQSEIAKANKIVALTHGKNEKAGRDKWLSIAKARHNRDVNGENEPALDLLEDVLKHKSSISTDTAERWAGDYPITVLDEAMKKIAKILNYASASELVKGYKKSEYRDNVIAMVIEIGRKEIGFPEIRNADSKNDFAVKLGFPPPIPQETSKAAELEGKAAQKGQVKNGTEKQNEEKGKASPKAEPHQANQPTAVAPNDPRSIMRFFRNLQPKGANRGKIELLRKEICSLKLSKNPIAFCFLLRSMFEISAKTYCENCTAENSPKNQKSNGEDRKLADVLNDIYLYITNDMKDKAKVKELHGAITELKKEHGLLSVTSMNQLVHNAKFSITESDISSLFGNISPLLEEIIK